MNETEILNLAGDRVQEVGLWQDGHGGDGTCISNAIGWAGEETDDDDAEDSARVKVMKYLGLGDDVNDLFAWNDVKERTASEVIEVLRACAVIEAAKEHEASRLLVLADAAAGVRAVGAGASS